MIDLFKKSSHFTGRCLSPAKLTPVNFAAGSTGVNASVFKTKAVQYIVDAGTGTGNTLQPQTGCIITGSEHQHQ